MPNDNLKLVIYTLRFNQRTKGATKMFNDISTLYLEKCLVVIPLKGKIPVIKEWNKLQYDSQILEQNYPNHNIGILTGKINNIVVIDIDKDEALSKCPPSPVIKKGKKGESRFFKYNGEKAVKRHDLGIEILSDGNQTVIPPSIHPETNQSYLWITPDTMENFDVEDLPVIPKAFLDSLGQNKSKTNFEGRHNKLVSIMGSCISQLMEKEQAVKHCFEYDQINHAPPYYTDHSELHRGQGLAAAAKMYESVKQTATNTGTFIDPEELKKVYLDIEALTATEQEKVKKVKFLKLPKLEGIGQLIFNDIYSNSHIPRTQFSFMATIQIMSHIIGNKVSFMGNCANLYQYGLAPSGSGKDFPYRRVVDYLNAVDKRILASNSPTSESVVLIQIEKNREKLFAINEAESLIKRIMNSNTNHGLKESLTDLYDMPMKLLNSKKVLSGKGKETTDYESVFSPYVGMLLMSTQAGFEKNIDEDAFNTGFMSRFLMYFEDRFKKAKFKEDRNYSPNSKIVEGLSLIYNHGRPVIADLSNTIDIVDVKPTKEAKEFYISLFESLEDEKENAFNKTRFMGIIGRKMQFINKFAIIHHVMVKNVNFHQDLEKESLIWASAAVNTIISNMVIHLDKHVHEVQNSRYDKITNKILTKIKDSKSKGMTKSEILRFCHISSRERNAVIPDLIEKEEITYCEKSRKFYTAL